jgi:hypothetical protein
VSYREYYESRSQRQFSNCNGPLFQYNYEGWALTIPLGIADEMIPAWPVDVGFIDVPTCHEGNDDDDK